MLLLLLVLVMRMLMLLLLVLLSHVGPHRLPLMHHALCKHAVGAVQLGLETCLTCQTYTTALH